MWQGNWSHPENVCVWNPSSSVNCERVNFLCDRPDELCSHIAIFQVIWGGLLDLGSNEPNRCEPNQTTYRQHLPKVCVQQFHGQNEDQFLIFWALLVQFGLGILCKEGICQIWIFGFLRSKRSNLEVQKKWGVNVEMSLYLRRHKYLVKEVYWWNVVCCMGCCIYEWSPSSDVVV